MTTTLSADEMKRLRRLIELARGGMEDVVVCDYLYQSLKLLRSAEGATASDLARAGLAAKERRDAATVTAAYQGGTGMGTTTTGTTPTLALDDRHREAMRHDVARFEALEMDPTGGESYRLTYDRLFDALGRWGDKYLVAQQQRIDHIREAAWTAGNQGGWLAFDRAMRASGMHEPILDPDDVPLGPPTAADYAHDIPEHAGHFSPF